MDEAGSCASGGGFRLGVDNLDEPPNSRIFLVISKYTSESVLRERFSPFGEIQDIWVVRDRHTKESKGIAFVKFARSSQACRAMEEMHGQCLTPSDTKPIKVRGPRTRCPGWGARGSGFGLREGQCIRSRERSGARRGKDRVAKRVFQDLPARKSARGCGR